MLLARVANLGSQSGEAKTDFFDLEKPFFSSSFLGSLRATSIGCWPEAGH